MQASKTFSIILMSRNLHFELYGISLSRELCSVHFSLSLFIISCWMESAAPEHTVHALFANYLLTLAGSRNIATEGMLMDANCISACTCYLTVDPRTCILGLSQQRSFCYTKFCVISLATEVELWPCEFLTLTASALQSSRTTIHSLVLSFHITLRTLYRSFWYHDGPHCVFLLKFRCWLQL